MSVTKYVFNPFTGNFDTVTTPSIIIDADGDTKVDVEESANENIIRFDTAGLERWKIDSSGNLLPGANRTYSIGNYGGGGEVLSITTNTMRVSGVQTGSMGSALQVAGNDIPPSLYWFGIEGGTTAAFTTDFTEGVFVDCKWNLPSTGTFNGSGLRFQASNIGKSLDFYGISGYIDSSGTEDLVTGTGVLSEVRASGANITTAKGISAFPTVSSGRTMSTYSGLYLGSKSGTGTISNFFGVNQVDTSASNYFAGRCTLDGGGLLNDNDTMAFGDASDALIYYDATNLVIHPASVGTGRVCLGPLTSTTSSTSGSQSGGNNDLLVNRIGLGGSPVNNFYWINYDLTTTQGRGALAFFQNYTGSGGLQYGILSKVTYSGTNASPQNIGMYSWSVANADNSGTSTHGFRSTIDISSTLVYTQGTHNHYGVDVTNTGVGGTHTGGTIRRIGFNCAPFSALTLSGATEFKLGFNIGEDSQFYDDKKLYFGGTQTTNGTSWFIYNSSTTDMDWYVGSANVIKCTSTNITHQVNTTIADAKDIVLNTTTGTKIATGTTQKLGFWNATPITQPANTVAIDSVLVNTGLRASGAVANFATTVTPPTGTATAGTAPVKFTAGTNLTTPEAGAMEFDGTFYYVSF